MLGCKANRIQNMKKLARASAYRLSKEHMEKQAALLKAQNKNEGNKFNFKRKTQVSGSDKQQPQSTNYIVGRKKVDDVNTEYIKYVEQRKTVVKPQQEE